MADRIINISIYFTYLVIASVSVVISYKVSLVMSLIVLAIECVRMMAIYKKAYGVILLVFILNTFLIGYNGYKSQSLIEYNNTQIIAKNSETKAYIQEKKTILSANKFTDLKSEIRELQNISVDWWLLVGVYIILELSLILLIVKINKQEKQIIKPKIIKKDRLNEKKETNTSKKDNMQNLDSRSASSYLAKRSEVKYNGNNKQDLPVETEEKLEYVGSYAEYYKLNDISRSKAKAMFDDWKAKGLLIKKDGKNYLRSEV